LASWSVVCFRAYSKMAQKKLVMEVERMLKKCAESIDHFHDLWQKMEEAPVSGNY
jgi:hypothetical protein